MRCLVLFIALVYSGECMESVYMKHAEMEDQAASASGYAYQLHSGGPLSYAYPNVEGENLNHLRYAPVALGGQGQELQVQDYKPLQQLNGFGFQGLYPAQGFALGGYPHQGYALQQPRYQVQPLSYAAPKLYTDVSNFVKGGGSSFSDANESNRGEKGSSGYKTIDQYAQGAKGLHDNKGHKEHYNAEGGHKNNHQEVAGHYGKKDEAAKGYEGASFSQSSGHKKGSKTTGYHKVHHKDEYKKDHSFYDESDARGHFNKHGDYNSQHASANGGFEKGGKEDAAYQQENKGVKGFKDEGKYVDQDSGYKGEEGQQAHHKDYQSYANKGEQQEGKEHGYVQKEGVEKLL